MSTLRVTFVLLAGLTAAVMLPRLRSLQHAEQTGSAGRMLSTNEATHSSDSMAALGPGAEARPVRDDPPRVSDPRETRHSRARYEFLHACALAAKEPDLTKRQEAVLSALTEWATTDVSAAADWLFTESSLQPDAPALSALFDGGKAEPAAAIAVARSLTLRYPASGADIASHLIAALSRADEHELGAQFALTADATHALPLLAAAYTDWGRQQPEEALMSALALGVPETRKAAFRAAVSGWAKADPKTLAEQAYQFPKGEERDFALVTALRQWAARDGEAAASFLAQAGPLPNPELILED